MKVSVRLSFVATAMFLLAFSAATAEAQVAGCRACAIAQERCAVNCFGREDKRAMTSCLIGCDNAAALCSCDEPDILSSEEYVARFAPELITDLKAAACHSTTPCGSAYGSCAAWSSYSDCGDPFCGIAFGCGECNEWGQCEAGGPAEKQYRERFRVCFNAQGQSCTEYQRTSSTGSCGC